MQKDYDEESCDYIKYILPDHNTVCKVFPIQTYVKLYNSLQKCTTSSQLLSHDMHGILMYLYYYILKEKNAEAQIEVLVPAHLFAGSSLRTHTGARAPARASSLPTHTRLDY